MSNEFELKAEIRKDVGKGASRRLRREAGLMPAIIYGAGKDAVNLTLEHHKLSHALENEAFYSHILTLNIGKDKEQVVLKALQRHPYKKQILHADFMRIKADEELDMNVPLHFVGQDDAPGAKEGGVVSHHMTEVLIRCLPKNLPEYIDVDISSLEMNGMIHLKEVKLPAGVQLVALLHSEEEGDLPVVSIHEARAIEEPEAAPEAAETEITTEKAEEGGEQAAAPTEEKAESSKDKK